jgi:hypothetical protein
MRYTSPARAAEAIQWDGTNTEEVVAFVGTGNALVSHGRFQVRGNGEPEIWRDMFPGYWVRKDPDGWTCLTSPAAFEREWTAVK